MQQNINLTISVASSRMATKWIKQNISWFDFVEKLRVPIKSTETLDQYLKLPKDQQATLKDVGGYIGGELADGSRKEVLSRQIVTLDLDNIPAGKTNEVLEILKNQSFTYSIHSTRKHAEYAPRLRVEIPLDKPVGPDEYVAISRMLANFINIEYCDPTTFQANRLMYWPSCCSDSQYIFDCDITKPYVSTDEVLKLYTNAGLDWKDVRNWPTVSTEIKKINREMKQKDPLEKDGPIGAFCRSYTILEAIEKYLPDAYEPCDVDNRLTYTGGSTTGGALIYDDKFLYSNHATDPTSNILCNAFDLVRIHKFGHLDDEGIKKYTRHDTYPSFKEMIKLVKDDPQAILLLAEERADQIAKDFGEEGEDNTWMKELTGENDKIDSTSVNVLTILENHPYIKGKLRYEEFSNTLQVLGPLPWNPSKEIREWKNIDDTRFRVFLEEKYKITGEKKINDATNTYFDKNKYNELQEYIKGLEWDGIKRLDTALIDFLGAEDNIFTREATRKTFVAGIARAMAPVGVYIKWDIMTILSGPQGCGKSTFIRIPSKKWYSDSLRTFEGKEACESLRGMWFIEVGEMDAMNRSETSAVKAYISKVEDVYRPPYGKRPEKFPRQCIFWGTTNDNEILRDNTGNRRFWIIAVGINKPSKNVWMKLPYESDQIMAEAYHYYLEGESLLLSPEAEKIAKEIQEEFQVSNIKEGIIKEFLEKEVPTDWYKRTRENRRIVASATYEVPKDLPMMKRDRICAMEIIVECFGENPTTQKGWVSKEINSIIRKIGGWEESKSSIRFGEGYNHQKGFKRIDK